MTYYEQMESIFVPQVDLCGDDSLGVAINDPIERHSAAEYLRETGVWLECIEGMQSIVVQFDAATLSIDMAQEQLRGQLDSVSISSSNTDASLLEIPVCYGGEYGTDLESLCQMLDLTADELIELHTSAEYRIEMLGFTPGFAYLGGLSANLSVPRLAEPRQRVAAGSVGIADGLTGLYALPGPGGWPLIGRTPVPLFQAGSDEPFLLSVGMRVRFMAIDAKAYRRMVAA